MPDGQRDARARFVRRWIAPIFARYIIDEVQDVLGLQGVRINDKHIEVVLRLMLRRVQIEDPGETAFITGEQAERAEVLEE